MTETAQRLYLFLKANPGSLHTHNAILEGVWGTTQWIDHNILCVYVGQVRKALNEDSGNHEVLKNVRGLGYVLEVGGQ